MLGTTIDTMLTRTSGNRQYPMTHTLWKNELLHLSNPRKMLVALGYLPQNLCKFLIYEGSGSEELRFFTYTLPPRSLALTVTTADPIQTMMKIHVKTVIF